MPSALHSILLSLVLHSLPILAAPAPSTDPSSPSSSSPSFSSGPITCDPSKDHPGPANPSFEDGTLNGWTIISGTAFSNSGSISSATSYWGGPFDQVGTYHLWGFAAAGDGAVGELHSSSFAASSALSFLIGGGYDPDNLYVALVRDADNKVLYKQTGANDEAYVRVVWNTVGYAGENVHLVVYDNATAAWGHVNVDDVRVGCAALGDTVTVSAAAAAAAASGVSASEFSTENNNDSKENDKRDENDNESKNNGKTTKLTFNVIGQANTASGTQSQISLFSNDALRPQYHYTPYQGWINDPAGLIKWSKDNRHHLFSQYNPAEAVWGPMHWSHADSSDGVHWRNLPVALYPPYYDTDKTDTSGRFTGSAVTDPKDSSLRLVFTEFTDTTHHPGATPETVWTATSGDGTTFVYPSAGGGGGGDGGNTSTNPIIATPPADSGNGFRDPKVFYDAGDNRYKMVVGSGDNDKGGKVQLFAAAGSLTTWDYVGVLYQGDGSRGAMWECPNFFPITSADGKTTKWALFYGGNEKNWYEVGTFDGTTFQSEKVGLLDYGPDFYAAQYYQEGGVAPPAQKSTSASASSGGGGGGRVLAIGWMGNWDQNARFVSRLNGWAGAQGVTRELFLKADGGLGSRPIAQISSLASGSQIGGTSKTKDVSAGSSWTVGSSNQAQFTVTFDLASTSANIITVKVFGVAASGGSDAVLVTYNKATETLTLDTTHASSYGWPGTWSAPVIVDSSNTLSLTLLMDRSSLEVFSAEGVSLTAWVWPKYVQSNQVQVVADGQGSVRVTKASLVPFGSAWVS
ncbi:glycoside hydrolase family 32 protein [Xylona heveae TC161]|uniref:beta-fructofuranosidase n=1 Tax=Xylona heveae (strain CBS 132557 / TC161) TaxID=1328760 RepID=A0A165FAY8_XYLHT|nr:glycoside hydrolase family 32 protein [Xylona heveae TC161]KZF20775.1 glycoside hydrolase family 32 protein [Xylona heveae TC161]